MADSPHQREPRSSVEVDAELLEWLRALPAAISLKAANGQYLYLSPLAHQLFGPRDGSAVGSADDLFPREVAEELASADRRVIDVGEVVMMPIWLPDKTGHRKHFAVIKFPVLTKYGPSVGTLALNIAIFSAAAWDASTYQQILNAISDMILVKGPGSKLRWANKAFLDAYGMSNTELQGLIDGPFVEPDLTQQYVKDDEAVFTTGRTLDIPEEPFARANGKVRTVHTVKSPILDDSGNVVMTVALIRDITEKKRLELDLRQAQKLESIGRLASGMAHEINTPLQFVSYQADFAQSSVTTLLQLVDHYRSIIAKIEAGTETRADASRIRDAEAAADLAYLQEHLPSAFDAMREGSRRIAELVQALKTFGHPDAGVHQQADINSALRTTLIIAANEYKHVADATLDLGDIPPVVCNISELNQVFLNLIVNAAHAIADRESNERGAIRITSRVENDDVVVTVADTGCGIPESLQGKIFDPFFTTKTVGRGTGQGLAIARNVVDRHGGTLTFVSEVGRGTTFHVRVPRSGHR